MQTLQHRLSATRHSTMHSHQPTYKFTQAIALEAERRECADCKIVNYVNSTFAPRLITDFAAGTTSEVAQVYNPLRCGCGC